MHEGHPRAIWSSGNHQNTAQIEHSKDPKIVKIILKNSSNYKTYCKIYMSLQNDLRLSLGPNGTEVDIKSFW